MPSSRRAARNFRGGSGTAEFFERHAQVDDFDLGLQE